VLSFFSNRKMNSTSVILDANCFFTANQQSRSVRLCYCYVCAPTQTLQVPCSEDWVDNNWIIGCETPQTQLKKFLVEMHEPGHYPDALHYWHERRATWLSRWHCLDLLAAPASQAYVERVFSVCGLLTQGHHNRMTKSLEMKARLKLNAKVFAWTDYNNNVGCRNKAYCDV